MGCEEKPKTTSLPTAMTTPSNDGNIIELRAQDKQYVVIISVLSVVIVMILLSLLFLWLKMRKHERKERGKTSDVETRSDEEVANNENELLNTEYETLNPDSYLPDPDTVELLPESKGESSSKAEIHLCNEGAEKVIVTRRGSGEENKDHLC